MNLYLHLLQSLSHCKNTICRNYVRYFLLLETLWITKKNPTQLKESQEEFFKSTISFNFFLIKGQLNSKLCAKFKVPKLTGKFLFIALKFWSYVWIIPTFYIRLYIKRGVIIFNLICKQLQTYDFLLIFSDGRLI